MSDDEGSTKKSGYRLEYASSARAKCKGPKPCAGNAIGKGELRVGSLVDFRGKTNFAWRHWGCTTTKIFSNMKSQFESAHELDGFDELKDEDKERIRKAWADGRVADEDIPETAKKPAGDEANDSEEKPKKRAPAKSKKDAVGEDDEKPKRKRTKAKKAEGDEDNEAEGKPMKATARKPRAKKIAASSDVDEKAESEEKPKKRAPARKPAAEKKAPAKKGVVKKDEEDSGEDFAEAIADVHDDEEESEEEGNKKRKRPATSKSASTKKTKVTSKAKKSKEVVEEEEEEE